jgi:ATP-grasp domain
MNILLLGIGTFGEFGLTRLRQKGHFIAIIDEPQNIPVNICDKYYYINRKNPDLMIFKQCYEIILNSGIVWDVILCWDELLVGVAAQIVEQLKINGPSLKVENFRNKYIMRETLYKNNFKTPKYYLINKETNVNELCKKLTFPCVLKPVDFGGSSGVILINNNKELKDRLNYSLSKSKTKECIVEDFIEGKEYSVETITYGFGKHYTFGIIEKNVSAPPFFIELSHKFPADLSQEDYMKIINLTHKALDSLGMKKGASHTEVKITKDGPVIIEIGGRLAGGLIPKLIYLSTDLDLYDLEVKALTNDFPTTLTKHKCNEVVSCINFLINKNGMPLKLPNIDFELYPLLKELKYWYKEGSQPPVLRTNGGRIGYYILSGKKEEINCVRGITKKIFSNLS